MDRAVAPAVGHERHTRVQSHAVGEVRGQRGRRGDDPGVDIVAGGAGRIIRIERGPGAAGRELHRPRQRIEDRPDRVDRVRAKVLHRELQIGLSVGHADRHRPDYGSQPVMRPSSVIGTMTISVSNGQTDLQFSVKNLRPNTIYTIWTVFYPLAWPMYFPPGSARPALDPNYPTGPAGYYVDAGVVAPTASLSAHFTNGMGLDPGVTFVTDSWGYGSVHLTLDYNILGNAYDDGPPLGTKSPVTPY